MFDWLEIDLPAVMGVVNVTPDSFSDGGLFVDPAAAVRHGLDLVASGADLLDVGGESTRPGAEPVPLDEELARVVPVVRGLADATRTPLSVDTTKASVAESALDAGASVVNDVSAGRFDEAMMPMVAARGAAYIVMHMRGEPRTMQRGPRYDDVVVEVTSFLVDRLDAARASGIHDTRLAADPGIGFGKTTEQNLELLARLTELREVIAAPVVVGTSRKRFIASVLREVDDRTGEPSVRQREEGTLATVAWAIEHGADIVRVHDVAPSARVAQLARGVVA